MDTVDFITLSFTLACTLGPLLGFSLAVAHFVLQSVAEREFSVTFGRQPPGATQSSLAAKEKQAYDAG